MRYKIVKIKSRRLLFERASFVLCLLLYMLCFALSVSYSGEELPIWIYEMHL